MSRYSEIRTVLYMDAPSTEIAVENAISAYHLAKSEADQLNELAAEAKRVLAEIMEETGETKYNTPAGKVSITAPSRSVSYDWRALDALCESNEELARILRPHRKESQRAGTMRISKP